MGYSNVPVCSLDSEIPQLPRTIYRVRVMAGFTQPELAVASGVSLNSLVSAENGVNPLPDSEWKTVLDVCGKRAFDYGPE